MNHFTHVSRHLGLWCIVLLALCAAGIQAQPALEQKTPATIGPLDAEARAQLLAFLPYLSFDNPLTLGRVRTPADVLAELERVEGVRKAPASANQTLLSVSRDVYGFLVGSREDLAPALQRITIPAAWLVHPADADWVIAGLIFTRAFVELARDQALCSWQRRVDEKCRMSYDKLMPLVRRAARGSANDDSGFTLASKWDADKWVYLVARHSWRAPLSNVTIRARLLSIDDRAHEHYFFVPSLPANTDYVLRVGVDWLPVGAERTVGAQFEVWSDEVIIESGRAAFDDNIPLAADDALNEIEKSVASRKRPKAAMNKISVIRPRLNAYQDRVARAIRLEAEAKSILDEAVEKIEEKIAKIDRDISKQQDVLTDLRNRETVETDRRPDSAKKRARAQTEETKRKTDAELKKLRSQRADLMKEKAEWLRGDR